MTILSSVPVESTLVPHKRRAKIKAALLVSFFFLQINIIRHVDSKEATFQHRNNSKSNDNYLPVRVSLLATAAVKFLRRALSPKTAKRVQTLRGPDFPRRFGQKNPGPL